MIRKPDIPKFSSEAEEAEWWDQHQEETAKWMKDAIVNSQTTTLDEVLTRAKQRAVSSPTVSIHIDPTDLATARSLAASKGMSYEAYLQRLLHEALEREAQATSP